MKCIRCGHDSKFKDRTNRKCPKCRGRFAFEPRSGDRYTDAAFQNAIDAISAKGQLRWGAEHLYYRLARHKPDTFGCAIIATVVFVALALSGLGKGFWAFLIPALLAAVIVNYVWGERRRRYHVQLDLGKFDGMLRAWREAHGDPKGLIVRAIPRGTPAPPRPLEADIADYSFDRAVICDRARTVDLLLANNFHFENNCAVLSIDGYPEAQFETVRAMLKRNPRLRVYALHDATPEGCRLAHTLATESAWFKGQARVTDVGLRPAQVTAFAGMYWPHTGLPVKSGNGIAWAESLWLTKYSAELAIISPEQTLKRLYKAMTRTDTGDGGGDSGGGSDGGGGGGSSSSDTPFAGGGGDSGGAGSSVTYDSDSFTHEASDVESDSDGFG